MEMQSKIQADRSWGSGFFGITQKIYDIFLNLSGTIVSFIVIFPLFVFALQTGSVWLGSSLALVLPCLLHVRSFLLFGMENES